MLVKPIIITKKQFFILYGLFFCFFVFSLSGVISGVLGFVSLVAVILSQYYLIYSLIKKTGNKDVGFFAFVVVCGYYVISLSLLYYIIGLVNWTLIIWALCGYLISLCLLSRYYENFELPLLKIHRTLVIFFQNITAFDLIIIVLSVHLLVIFFNNPILNGSPTPWLNSNWLSFFIFFLISFCFLTKMIRGDKNLFFIASLYLFLIVNVIAIKYLLSFGYDSLLHQASLNYIDLHGQIDPLTPFYIGQYVLEILIHKVSGISFVFLERWLVPLFFWLMSLAAGFYVTRNLKLSASAIGLVPLSVLLLLPSFFTYTSPFAFSLIWVFVAAISLWLYLNTGEKEKFYLSLISALIALLIHPFVCLSVLLPLFFVRKFYDSQTIKWRYVFLFFFSSTLAVPLAFLGYHWFKGQIIFLKDPFYYADYFLAMFGDPAWYSLTTHSLGEYLIYLLEKAHLMIFGLVAIWWLFFDKKNRRGNLFLFAIALGIMVAAWFFVAGIEVEGYGYGDQINYSYRLVGIAQWLLWIFVFLIVKQLINWISQRKKIVSYILISLGALLLTVSFYITYPRNDNIVRANVNNIRVIDYEVIDYIQQTENGKDGYLVFANQIFGAAAIQKFGYKPYYDTKWGEVFYYSVPMSGELNQRYEKMMNATTFDQEIVNEVLLETGVDKAYFIITDYWPLFEETYQHMKESAAAYENFEDGKIEIFVFTYQYNQF